MNLTREQIALKALLEISSMDVAEGKTMSTEELMSSLRKKFNKTAPAATHECSASFDEEAGALELTWFNTATGETASLSVLVTGEEGDQVMRTLGEDTVNAVVVKTYE